MSININFHKKDIHKNDEKQRYKCPIQFKLHNERNISKSSHDEEAMSRSSKELFCNISSLKKVNNSSAETIYSIESLMCVTRKKFNLILA
jgi:hypothetical protein